MSLINQSDSKFPKEIFEKVKELYENYDLDMSDMSPEEISRVCRHYYEKGDLIDEDIRKSRLSKYSNKKTIVGTGNKNVKQKKTNW